MELPSTSFNTTIGMLVTGSIINPRIFISTSIQSPLPLDPIHDGINSRQTQFTTGSIQCLARERVWTRPRDSNVPIAARQSFTVLRASVHRLTKVVHAILRGP